MSLNYSNRETSVTIGESVRDEDGMELVQKLFCCPRMGSLTLPLP
jgi:phosphoribosylpyrophosphate synthetase